MELKVETKDLLVARSIKVEPGVNGMVVFHIYLEDLEGVLHHTAFATRMNYSESVMTAFRRLVVVRLPKDEDKLVRLHSRAVVGEEEKDAPGEGVRVDQSAGPGTAAAEESAVEVGAGVSGQPPGAVPNPEGDTARDPETVAGDHGDRR